ncbi:MAG TPA: hypothetical protein DCW42_08190 [Bacteroidetes bacterium]|nr:hypothetical protein [Bacteroidota bacterium]
MQKIKIKDDIRRHPLRGILTEIARERNITPQSVRQQIFLTGNPEMLKIYKKKKAKREREYESIRIK